MLITLILWICLISMLIALYIGNAIVLGGKVGILWNWKAFWIGTHYSIYNRRRCINVVPFFTIYIVHKGGTFPVKDKEKDSNV